MKISFEKISFDLSGAGLTLKESVENMERARRIVARAQIKAGVRVDGVVWCARAAAQSRKPRNPGRLRRWLQSLGL